MKELLFFLLLVMLAAASYLNYASWLMPAILLGIYAVSKIRHHNLARLKKMKIEQTISCCREYGITAEQVEAWFERPEFQEKENYMDVHPGREAEAIAKAHKGNRLN